MIINYSEVNGADNLDFQEEILPHYVPLHTMTIITLYVCMDAWRD